MLCVNSERLSACLMTYPEGTSALHNDSLLVITKSLDFWVGSSWGVGPPLYAGATELTPATSSMLRPG